MQLLALILAVVAYWRLLRFDPQPQEELLRELEEWFFVPTDTSPMVVLLLAGWLLYRRRDGWLSLIGRASSPLVAFVLAGFAVAAHAWSRHVGAADLLTFSLMASVFAVAALLAGRPGMRAVAVPAAFLVFAVPFPGPLLNAVIYRFQLWTADYAGSVLTSFGLPAFVANDQILLAADHFEVIEGCSGLRSVQTLTMVSVLLVDLFGRRGLHATAIVALAPVVAFALNGVRVMTLMLNPSSEIAAVHNIQGVAILLAGVMILYGLDGLFERFSRKQGAGDDAEASESSGAPAVALPATPKGLAGFFPVALMALLALVSFAVPDGSRGPAAKRIVERQLANDAQIADRSWQRTVADTDRAFLGTLGRQAFVDFWFERRPADPVSVEGNVREGAKNPEAVRLFYMQGDPANRLYSAVSRKTRYPGSGWEIETRGTRALPSGFVPGSSGFADWMVLRSGTRRQLVLHWRAGNLGFATELWRALVGLEALASKEPRLVRVFRLSTQLRRGDEASREAGLERIDALLEALAPTLGKTVRGTAPVARGSRRAAENFLSAIVPEEKTFSSATSAVFKETLLKQCVANRHVPCTTVLL